MQEFHSGSSTMNIAQLLIVCGLLM